MRGCRLGADISVAFSQRAVCATKISTPKLASLSTAHRRQLLRHRLQTSASRPLCHSALPSEPLASWVAGEAPVAVAYQALEEKHRHPESPSRHASAASISLPP